MTTDSVAAIRIAPDSAWGARLKRAGRGLELFPFDQDALDRSIIAAGAIGADPAALAEHGAWLEDFLWNELLPRQRANGRFSRSDDDISHDACVAALEAILSGSARWTSEEFRVSIAVPSAGAFEARGAREQANTGDQRTARVQYKLETDYPRTGVGAITFYSEAPVDFTFSLRLPAVAQAVQITRNGATYSLSPTPAEDGLIRLPGPWQHGDSVRFGFGIPFRILRAGRNALNDRPVDRAYPGAATLENAIIYHGVRALAPLLPGLELGGPAETPSVAMGVRKDGVFRLSPASVEEIESLQSPFAAPGDLFRSSDTEPILMIARSLWASVTDDRLPAPIPVVDFVPYETSFDRGA